MKKKSQESAESLVLRRSPRVQQSSYHCVDVRLSESRDSAVVALSMLVGEPEAIPSGSRQDGAIDWNEVMGVISLDDVMEVFGTRCRFDVIASSSGQAAQLVVLAVRPAPSAPKQDDPVASPPKRSINEPYFVAQARQAAMVIPQARSVGFFAANSNPIAPGGLYLWFSSVRAMKRHLIMVEPAIALGAFHHSAVAEQQGEYDKLAGRIRRCLGGVEVASDLSPSVARTLSKILSDTHVTWVGSFADLCAGGDRWARQARCDFRNTTARRHPVRETAEARRSRLEAPLHNERYDRFAHFVCAFEL